MEFIIQKVVPSVMGSAMVIALLGFTLVAARFSRAWLTLPREINSRTNTPYQARRKSWWEAFYTSQVHPYLIWWRANPVTMAGHCLYHCGLFIGMGSYGLVAGILAYRGTLWASPIGTSMRMIFDWFQYQKEIFGSHATLGICGNWLYCAFVIALVIAVVGIATPFIMSALRKRGMIRPIDPVLEYAGIRNTPGLRIQGFQRLERKAIGVIVLVMDAAMASTFIFPMASEVTYLIHATFAAIIVAALPGSFLFHEIYRVRALTAMLRVREGRTA